ncbi:hypothetical protein I302_104534 [Kwoniella bestiolae CBS 10118]|uniref:SnoaL-like domain-containing protein n=1 Tax=Kwoniella bestiolae CBS 10118 TaxID=1296100 RepID=A0A1B9GBJ4_9TREE|nr:hypothetical protein I302_03240 [Kwoniella bestiolae CBS 10118]OCF28381.1 hypothetical protein I302_03240 [Kwoniella bestiolae CBS 10118]
MTLTKEYVESFLEHVNKNEVAQMMNIIDDNVQGFHISPDVKSTPASGSFNNTSEFLAIWAPIANCFIDPIQFAIQNLVVSGNTAVLELKFEGVGRKDGKKYIQYPCWILEFDDEEKPKIVKWRCYPILP